MSQKTGTRFCNAHLCVRTLRVALRLDHLADIPGNEALQVPFAVSQMGFGWGAALFVSITACSWLSGYALIDCCVRCQAYTWPSGGQSPPPGPR